MIDLPIAQDALLPHTLSLRIVNARVTAIRGKFPLLAIARSISTIFVRAKALQLVRSTRYRSGDLKYICNS